MKTYVITISTNFSKKHLKNGAETHFVKYIENKTKLHTIRANYELWKKRFEQIDKGEALLSVRIWTGKPYNSKQKEIFRYTNSDHIGIQKLKSWDLGNGFAFYIDKSGIVLPVEISELAKNDGLSKEDFLNWFSGYNLNEPMAILHFTGFRY
jgi:hypothetical protein